MYEPETILTLKEPRGTEDEPFPYDRVRVVGQSPINHELTSAEWVGAAGQGVIIQPLDGFGSTLDEPYGKLQDLYDVEFIPPNEIIAQPVTVVRPTSGSAGPTPEEQFSTHAKENPVEQEEGPHRRRRTKRSPLDAQPASELPAQTAPNRGAEEEMAPVATDPDEG